MSPIEIREDTHLAGQLNYPVRGFVLSLLSADLERYLFEDSTLKLR